MSCLYFAENQYTEADCQPIPEGGWFLIADVPGGSVEISGNNRARLAEMANELLEAHCISQPTTSYNQCEIAY
ncbi:hypothetical protein KCM76_10275 [Zooshikella marina]|uniref:hypothetical protein n=1 Tax=Zooshikella ganghwensis TaxID=202772 RepID=UPI001BB0B464|nr:hypothetical protein [Zooshikella ganghwensis]MBU2706375.1 hypothetical protein [Zooshikella ganghwensis]